jgi:hypothetical protein
MGDIVNLRRARKRKVREAAAREAADHRMPSGVSLTTRKAARSERELTERRLLGHRLDGAATGPAGDGE